MFVGEAPGANEDRLGLPFVGQAGKLLDKLLGEIGLQRADVFINNVLMCRPPGNRDPHPDEIGNCQDYLYRRIELIEPKVICTLGNFATKLLRGEPTGITRLHGQAEIRVIGGRSVRLYPLFHPAAALYTPSNVEVLREDFRRIPELLAMSLPGAPEPLITDAPPPVEALPEPEPEPVAVAVAQLGCSERRCCFAGVAGVGGRSGLRLGGGAGGRAWLPKPPSQVGFFGPTLLGDLTSG